MNLFIRNPRWDNKNKINRIFIQFSIEVEFEWQT